MQISDNNQHQDEYSTFKSVDAAIQSIADALNFPSAIGVYVPTIYAYCSYQRRWLKVQDYRFPDGYRWMRNPIIPQRR